MHGMMSEKLRIIKLLHIKVMREISLMIVSVLLGITQVLLLTLMMPLKEEVL